MLATLIEWMNASGLNQGTSGNMPMAAAMTTVPMLLMAVYLIVARRFGAFVLFLAAFILILGKVPLGQMIWDKALGWTTFSVTQVCQWLMDVPVVAGKRGIMMGLAIGGVVTAMKIIFGIERQYMGKD